MLCYVAQPDRNEAMHSCPDTLLKTSERTTSLPRPEQRKPSPSQTGERPRNVSGVYANLSFLTRRSELTQTHLALGKLKLLFGSHVSRVK